MTEEAWLVRSETDPTYEFDCTPFATPEGVWQAWVSVRYMEDGTHREFMFRVGDETFAASANAAAVSRQAGEFWVQARTLELTADG